MRIKAVGSAFVVTAVLVAVAGCSAAGDHGTRAPSAAPSAKRLAGRTADSRLAGDLNAARQAEAALLPGGDAAAAEVVVLSGYGEMDGLDRDDSVRKGQRLVIEAACVGRGSVTVTATSGRAVAHRVVPCGAAPQVRSFALTTAEDSLDIERDAGRGAVGGVAYLVRKAR